MTFQTYFVYFSLILVMLFFAKISANYAKFRHVPITHYSILIPVIFFSLVIGLRYMVGIDYESYLDIIQYSTAHYYFDSIEPSYQYLIMFIEKYSLHFSYFFIISAFIQIFFFYESFDRSILFLLPWAIPLFIMSEIGLLQNIVRHFTAVMMFFYSLKHIKNQKLIYYVGTILIASLFHKSVLICLPLYFFVGKEIIKSDYLRWGLVLIVLITSTFLRDFFLSISRQLITMLGYAHHLESSRIVETGLGLYIQWMLNFILIGFYTQLKEAYQKNGFIIYWNIIYLGFLLKPMLDYLGFLERMNVYFYNLRFILFAFLLHFLYQRRNNPVFMFFLVFVLFFSILIFIVVINKGSNKMSPFNFIWDRLYV